MIDLSNIKTCDLIKELEKRDGVKTEYAEPYQDRYITVNGPAKVLVIID